MMSKHDIVLPIPIAYFLIFLLIFLKKMIASALGFQINKELNIQLGYLRHRLGNLNLNRLQLALFLKTKN